MADKQTAKSCFIIMPITTPKEHIERYDNDAEHFQHVLETLFIPAVTAVGLDPILPKAAGSEIIQAGIIENLDSADLVLCDMSILNPNVFYEFGIRTALDKPVALVVDDKTADSVPFDAGSINRHKYDSSLQSWVLKQELPNLIRHLEETLAEGSGKNALWKYFGVKTSATFSPGQSTDDDKFDIIMRKLDTLSNPDRRIVTQTPKTDDALMELRDMLLQLKWPDIVHDVSGIRKELGVILNASSYKLTAADSIELVVPDASADRLIELTGGFPGPVLQVVIKRHVEGIDALTLVYK